MGEEERDVDAGEIPVQNEEGVVVETDGVQLPQKLPHSRGFVDRGRGVSGGAEARPQELPNHPRFLRQEDVHTRV